MGFFLYLKFFPVRAQAAPGTCNVLLAYGDPDIGTAKIPRCVLAPGSSGRGVQIIKKACRKRTRSERKAYYRITFAPYK